MSGEDPARLAGVQEPLLGGADRDQGVHRQDAHRRRLHLGPLKADGPQGPHPMGRRV